MEDLQRWMKENKGRLKPLLKYIDIKREGLIKDIVSGREPLQDQRYKGRYDALTELKDEIVA